MAITFAYTESTNTVVLTEGTSGTPATFADFVTFDRAGVDTVLFTGSPAADSALTYAVRPVEDLAILVKCVVANKTTEADYIFITGKDWRGAAQTESIDVSAGDASYETTKYWSEITTLDCSDNPAGGGNVWADGDLSVTQPIWGVIWDYGGRQYRIDAVFNIGNGTTTTYFASEHEQVYFNDDLNIIIKTNATCRLGKLQGDWGYAGSFWSWHNNSDSNMLTGTLLLYASRLHHRANNNFVYMTNGIFTAINSHLTSEYGYSSLGWQNGTWIFASANIAVTFKDVFMYDGNELTLSISPTIEGFHCHYMGTGLKAQYWTAVTATGLQVTSSIVRDLRTIGLPNLWLIDYIGTIGTLLIETAGNIIHNQYTCNIHIADKDGANLSGVTVDCEETAGTAVWTAGSITTDANGDITEQTITYKKWTGTSETLTDYSPHKFTISKAGYETLVLDNITVDAPIIWHLELQPLRARVYGRSHRIQASQFI